MSFPGRIESLAGPLPPVAFRWDAETEILAARLTGVRGQRGFSGSVEFEDGRGAVLTLDVELGVACGLEVVVWPEADVVDTLAPPTPKRQGRLVVPARPSQPEIGVVELEVSLSAERSADESVIHVRVGPARKSEPVSLGTGLIADVDGDGDVAGFWLVGVPPFPTAKGV